MYGADDPCTRLEYRLLVRSKPNMDYRLVSLPTFEVSSILPDLQVDDTTLDTARTDPPLDIAHHHAISILRIPLVILPRSRVRSGRSDMGDRTGMGTTIAVRRRHDSRARLWVGARQD